MPVVPDRANGVLALLAARWTKFELSRSAIDQALAIDDSNQDAALIKFSYLIEAQNKDEIEAFIKHALKSIQIIIVYAWNTRVI